MSMQTPGETIYWLGIRPEGWFTIAALILGPILALWIQRIVERRREERNRKLWVFRELMATRRARLSERHVQALNLIHIEFAKGDQSVTEAWKVYLDALTDANLANTRDDRFVDLMHAMSENLGYQFTKVEIRREAYSPVAHGELEGDQTLIRKGIVELLTGKRALSTVTWVMAPPPGQPPKTEAPDPKQPLSSPETPEKKLTS